MGKATKVKIPKEMTRKHLARAEREARQQRWLLIGLAVVLVSVIGLVGYGYLDEHVLKQQQPVATVNGKHITTAEFQKRVRFEQYGLRAQLAQLQDQRTVFASDPSLSFILEQLDQQISSLQMQLASPTVLGKRVLDTLIEEELVRQEAARRQITVAPEQVQTEIEHSFNFYRVPPTPTPIPTVTPTPLVSPTPEPTPTVSLTPTNTPAPTETPEPTPTPVTEQAYQAALSNYLSQIASTGMTSEDLNKLVEANLLRRLLQDEMGKQVPTSAEQIKFRYIEFEVPEQAQEAAAQLQSGASFDDLYERVEAGQVVSATASAESWMLLSDVSQRYTQPIADLVLSLGISQTSRVVTDTLYPGALILQVTGRGVQPLSSYQLQTQQQKAYQDWLDSQRKEPNVNLYDNRYMGLVPTPTS